MRILVTIFIYMVGLLAIMVDKVDILILILVSDICIETTLSKYYKGNN